MFTHVLAPATATLFSLLSQTEWVKSFYLGGGTAITLHLGHRQSVDLDFFSPAPFETAILRQHLEKVGSFSLDSEAEGTLHGTLLGVKVSFLKYEYPLLRPLKEIESINVADIVDLACMKLDAISSRGKKRDFVDLYAIIQQRQLSLESIFACFDEKFANLHYNTCHLLKSLTYFKDADGDPDPVFIAPIHWKDVTAFFQREAKRQMIG